MAAKDRKERKSRRLLGISFACCEIGCARMSGIPAFFVILVFFRGQSAKWVPDADPLDGLSVGEIFRKDFRAPGG